MKIKPAKISKVLPNSIGEEIGFEAGDAILSINGIKPRDLIDYQFLCAEEILQLEILDSQGKIHNLEIEKDFDMSLGLEFETALFDSLIQCNNNCPFCFIDQQPPGKRKTLYLKDDDYRLSFLYGSYLTLTNLSPKEWQRIEQMRLSPLYISVHATEPEIRKKLLKNPQAGEIKNQLKWFESKDLQIHAQVVVCPGINDQKHLQTTLLDLASFHNKEFPTVISAAVVPVGLTRFRPEKDELIPVNPAKAKEVIAQVESLQKKFYQQFNSNFVWLADEWFLIAQQELPSEFHYEDYPQIGNGVGSIRQFIKEFQQIGKNLLPQKINTPKTLTWVVGNAVEKAFQPLVKQLNQVEKLHIKLAPLRSEYWGVDITVTGLLTGQDLVKNLKNQDLGDGILIPSLMLKHDDTVFLDDMTIEEVSKILNTSIFPVNGVEELIKTCISTEKFDSI